MDRPWARFDDLRAGRTLAFGPPERILVATRPEEVVGVLRQVDDATAAGRWAFGFVAYEAASGLDPDLPGGPSSPGEPPLAWFGLCDEPTPAGPLTSPARGSDSLPRWVPDWSDDDHARAVTAVRDRIAAGVTYQCNLTDRLRTTLTEDPRDLYARLALAQRGAYNAYLDLPDHAVACATPELFFEWAGDVVRTRPMKGTAPRGRTKAEDGQRSRQLRSSAKEQAENLMIVDLLRNDLGRVAEVGGVTVEQLFALERYPTVWQMTSRISARVAPETGLVDLFRALFPCGSVTGAPKRATMQLIAELEPTPRGVYCGTVGWAAPPSAPVRARFGVAIRTAVVDRATGDAVYGAGGGITWGSDAARERAELRAKAAVLDHDGTEHRLLETLAARPGEGLDSAEDHLARMADSAEWAGYRFDRAAAREVLRAAVGGLPAPARVRLLLARDGRLEVDAQPLPAPPPGPVRLVLDDDPVDAADPWLQHSSTRRDLCRARATRYPQADDVVLVNERGELTGTTTANLAVRSGGRWWTPPTTAGCVPGVERARLLRRGVLHERVLHVPDLQRADALAVVGSLHGWREARLLAGVRPSGDRDRDGSRGSLAVGP